MVRWSPESVTLAMPKSVTFTRSPASIMMFAGLMSRWTTLFLWAKSRASATWAPIEAARSSRQLALGDHLLEAHPVDELHGQVAQAVGVADVVDGDDVRVLELGRDLRLALEAVEQLVEARALAAARPSRRMVLMATMRPRILSLAL